MQGAHNQHHGKQQHQRGEIDVAKRVVGAQDPCGNHGNRPDNCGSRTIDLQARKLSQGKNQIAGKKDDIGGHNACV